MTATNYDKRVAKFHTARTHPFYCKVYSNLNHDELGFITMFLGKHGNKDDDDFCYQVNRIGIAPFEIPPNPKQTGNICDILLYCRIDIEELSDMRNENEKLKSLSKVYGNWLRQKRQKAGLSQKDVSKTFHYTCAQYVSNWECGKSLPPAATLVALSQLYKIDLNMLVKKTMDVRNEKFLAEVYGE